MDAIDKNVREQWDRELWRKPDVYTGKKDPMFPPIAIWYGLSGVEGDVATMAELESGYYLTVSEYQDITGYIDEPTKEDLENPFLVTSTTLDLRDVLLVLSRARIRRPRSTLQLIRWAVGIGVAYIAYYGGSEERTDELPR
jgi:hypothetical protein